MTNASEPADRAAELRKMNRHQLNFLWAQTYPDQAIAARRAALRWSTDEIVESIVRGEAKRAASNAGPVAAVDQLGAAWSPDLDAYAAGEIDAAAIRCVLCKTAPCSCAPFGSPAYLAAVDRLHGTRFAR